MAITQHAVGNWTIEKIHEITLDDYAPETLFPGLKPSVMASSPSAADRCLFNPDTGKVSLSVHTWLIRGGGKTILVDTGVGNEKDRPTMKVLDHLHTPYLDRLAQSGVTPADVDYVLLTHVHADHVGWNTKRDGIIWTPTFPNATILCSDLEYRYAAALAAKDNAGVRALRVEVGLGDPIRTPVDGVFADSIRPVEVAGRLQRVVIDGSEVLDGIRYVQTPGHSIDHASIVMTSRGEQAVFGGDVMHHPIELTEPDLVSMFCEFPDATRRSRHALLEQIADTQALYFSSHFPGSSVGRVERDGSAYKWSFVEGTSLSAGT